MMFNTSFVPSVPKFGGGYSPKEPTYIKLPEAAVKEILGRISDRTQVVRGKRRIRYTNTTLNVLRAIIQRVDRTTNTAKLGFDALMKLAGIRNRTTLADHLHLLEHDVRFVMVMRSKSGPKRNAINVYKLIGMVADCVLKPTQSAKKFQKASKTASHSPMSVPESLDMDGWDTDIPSAIKDFGIDTPVLIELIQEHGIERVQLCVEWVKEQGWVKNPPGLAVKKIKDAKFDPTKTKSARRKKAASTPKDGMDYVGGEFGNLFNREIYQPTPDERKELDALDLVPPIFSDRDEMLAWLENHADRTRIYAIEHVDWNLVIYQWAAHPLVKHSKLVQVNGDEFVLATRDEKYCGLWQSAIKGVRRILGNDNISIRVELVA